MNPMHSLCLSHGGCFFFFSRLRLCCFCFSLITSHSSKTSFSFRCKFSENRRRIVKNRLIILFARQTFAWFTSKDEVTNRLSANAAYDVSIAEDFQPPEDWIPGQTINKDVSAVNTGNVDAFVRMWLEGEMSVLNRNAGVAVSTASTAKNLEKVTDSKYTSVNLNYTDGTNYYRELSTAKVKNPELNDSGDAAESGTGENNPATFSEVQAVQAGGYLAYAPASANYYFIVEHDTSVQGYAASDGTTLENFELKEGDIIATKGAAVDSTDKTVVYIDAGTSGINIDSSQFFPQTEGTYIFRRNVELNASANTKDDYEYSGYYYVPKNGGTDGILKASDTGSDHYFALYTDTSGRSDYTLPDADIIETTVSPSKDVTSVTPAATLRLYTASETTIKNNDLTWTYKAPNASGTTDKEKNGYFTVKYNGVDGTSGTTTGDTADDIIIDIALANIGTTGQTWTAMTGTGKTTTFYYNDDVESGDTTTILVDNVTLSKDTTQYAFLAFDFDLNVFMDSVQVTMDENGKEMIDSAKEQFSNAPTGGVAITAANVVATNTGDEITSINWNKTT